MFDRFNHEARELFRLARREAQRHRHGFLGTGHLLLAILSDHAWGSRAAGLLGVDAERVRTEVDRLLWNVSPPATVGDDLPAYSFTPLAERALAAGAEFAREEGQDWIGVDHVLAGLIRIQEGSACRAVVGAGGQPAKILERLHRAVATRELGKVGSLGSPHLRRGFRFNACCTDLSTCDLDPVVGRESEISRLRNVLARRRRGNAVVVGAPGVGKTAVVHGLVSDSPSIWELDVPLLLAGTECRGDLEFRILRLATEALRKNRVLFIDDLHILADGVLGEDAEVVRFCLRRTLDQHGVLIGSLSTEGYRAFRREDPAFLECFQPVFIAAATAEESVEIVAALRDRYLSCDLPDELLPTLVELARLYVPERELPGSAVDLLDEVGVASHAERVDEEALVRITAQMTEIPTATIAKREPGRSPWLGEPNGEA